MSESEKCPKCDGWGAYYASYADQMDHKLTTCKCMTITAGVAAHRAELAAAQAENARLRAGKDLAEATVADQEMAIREWNEAFYRVLGKPALAGVEPIRFFMARLTEYEADNARLKQVVEWIDKLRNRHEGASLCLYCDNPEGVGPNNSRIDIQGYFGGEWARATFRGASLTDCLAQAIAAETPRP